MSSRKHQETLFNPKRYLAEGIKEKLMTSSCVGHTPGAASELTRPLLFSDQILRRFDALAL